MWQKSELATPLLYLTTRYWHQYSHVDNPKALSEHDCYREVQKQATISSAASLRQSYTVQTVKTFKTSKNDYGFQTHSREQLLYFSLIK
jgi:hypothetical protein